MRFDTNINSCLCVFLYLILNYIFMKTKNCLCFVYKIDKKSILSNLMCLTVTRTHSIIEKLFKTYNLIEYEFKIENITTEIKKII